MLFSKVTGYRVNTQTSIYFDNLKTEIYKDNTVHSIINKHELLRDGCNECAQDMSAGNPNVVPTEITAWKQQE